MVRCMRVARMAHALGKQCIPHISGSGLGYLYMMHFVSAIPNAGRYHEFKEFNDELPLTCATSTLRSDDAVDLVKRVWTDAPTLAPGLSRAAALAVVAAGLTMGTVLAFATHAAGRVVARAMGVGTV